MNNERKKLVVVLGPTAIGKTALAVGLAQHLHTEILSADSRQFFTELNIGVARPSPEELSAVPHHFVAFLSIHEHYSAGMFEADALKLLDDLFKTHDTVICCGGSMLYIDALLYGLDDLPSDKSIRKELQQRLDTEGLEALVNQLQQLDPQYHALVDRQNPHRILRALEVCICSGKKYSELRKASKTERPFDIIKIGLTAEREWMYARINKRVDIMLEQGLLQEVESVLPYQHLNALNTVGYKELFDYFNGKCSLDEATERIKQHTRNFAKRQLTWWRRDHSIQWIEVDKVVSPLNEALTIIQG
ncbi:MAG TPA: tRNA (adenosine(37)-N6)-dimethylallyltransferase MiaA [Flavobacteriales bacterium]